MNTTASPSQWRATHRFSQEQRKLISITCAAERATLRTPRCS